MDFTVPEELAALRSSYAAFLDREVRPLEEDLAKELAAREVHPEVHDAHVELRKLSAREGFYGCYLPEHVGGQGVSTLGTTLLVEDSGRSGLTLAQGLIGPPNPGAPSSALLDAPPHVRDHYLRPLLNGTSTMCFALTEPEAGSDAQSITTRAERTPTGWVINGTKHYITGADDADLALTFAVTDPALRAAGGITAFIVPRDQYRVVRRQSTLADTHPYEIVLEDAQVPADHVVGEVGAGFLTAMKFLNAGRAYIGAMALGLAEFCLETAVDHASSRTAFGKPIGRNQGISFPLADMKVDIESTRWLTYHLAWQVDQATPGHNLMLDSSIVKLQSTEMAFRAADTAMQVLGGAGLMRELPIERIWRFLRVLRIVEGASEIQRLVIARSIGL